MLIKKLVENKYLNLIVVGILFISLVLIFLVQKNKLLKNGDYGLRVPKEEYAVNMLEGFAITEYAYQYGLSYNCKDLEPHYKNFKLDDRLIYPYELRWDEEDYKYLDMVHYGGFRLDDYLENHTIEEYMRTYYDGDEYYDFYNGKIYHSIYSHSTYTYSIYQGLEFYFRGY